jgi:hypothetical protein
MDVVLEPKDLLLLQFSMVPRTPDTVYDFLCFFRMASI